MQLKDSEIFFKDVGGDVVETLNIKNI